MKRWSRLVAGCMAFGMAGILQAQVEPPPPEKFAISAGGVDIRTGRYATNATDVSIGNLALTRILSSALFDHVDPFGNFSHNWDITLIEERIDIATGHYTNGSGLDYRITVNFGGRSETFQGEYTQFSLPQTSRSPYAQLTWSGDRNSANVVYTFVQSGGTRIVFRSLGTRDCAAVVRCAYPAQIIAADGTTTTFEYDSNGVPNGTRLRSVVNNLGYALLLEYSGTGASWGLVKKACVLNLTQAAKPANNVCPTTAVATSSYTYTSLENRQKLASITDALGRTSTLTYTLLSGASPYSGTMHTLGYTKPGQSIPWQVAKLAMMPTDRGLDQIVVRQDFADGSSYAYDYAQTPQVDGQYSSILGGAFTDALNHTTLVEYGAPRLPPTMNPPRFSGLPSPDDVNFQLTPGPQQVTDALGRITHFDYCDPNALAGLPAYVSDRCLVTNLQSVTDPQGVKTKYTFSLGHLIRTQRIAKAGSGLRTSSGRRGTTADPPSCCVANPRRVTDAKAAVTNFTYDPTHGGLLTETWPAPTAGAVRPQKRYTYTQLYAWYYNSSGALAGHDAGVEADCDLRMPLARQLRRHSR
jgi:hypothetical protein